MKAANCKIWFMDESIVIWYRSFIRGVKHLQAGGYKLSPSYLANNKTCLQRANFIWRTNSDCVHGMKIPNGLPLLSD